MGELTQQMFAALLNLAMSEKAVDSTELAELAGLSPETVARYRHPEYPSGPPRPHVRRILERALEMPEGSLDG